MTKNIVIINRWSDDFADYCNLLDHFENNVCYITNSNGSKYLKDKNTVPFIHYEVKDLNDYPSVKEKMELFIKGNIKVDILVAMSEHDMLIAGKLRSAYDIPGMSEQIALNFTNKYIMKSALMNSDVSIPAFSDDFNTINAFHKKHGFPVVLKPKFGASSKGVYIVENEIELNDLLNNLDLDKYEYEEYIKNDIYHVNGIIENNTIKFAKVMKYINTCYEYKLGKPLGNILVNNNDLSSKLIKFTNDVLIALGLKNGVFHLECFLRDNEPIFLEVGARQSGGEVVPLLRYLYNFDLIEAFFSTQIGKKYAFNLTQSNQTGGFLLFPVPLQSPCRVNKVKYKDEFSTLVNAVIPKVGDILNSDGDYYFNSGRFMFCGTEDKVLNDMNSLIESFEIDTELQEDMS